VIYLWYEKQPQRALELLTNLRDRHPRNPLFPQLIAQVQDVYLHDLPASLRTWRSLLDAARADRIAYAPLAEIALTTRHRVSARASQRRLRRDRATASGDCGKPLAPFGAYAEAQRELTRLNARTRSAR
jgi:hypothetical protein